jgi:hypothetical protein
MHRYIIIILFLRTLISQYFNVLIFNHVLIIIQDVCISTTDIYCYNNYTTFCKHLGSQSARYTYITLDLFFVGPEDDSRESKNVAQRY